MSAKFRRFYITRKVPESAIITSFYLSPCDDEPAWPAQPGQYLTLKIPTATGTVLKTYSLSNDVAAANELRITVKREPAPVSAPELLPGQGSTWLHDSARVGTEIEVAAPRGNFVLNQDSKRPVLLLSGGVGQTPLLSMLHSLAKSDRSVCYVHACQSAEVHAMHNEVVSLSENAGERITYRACYGTTHHNGQSEQLIESEHLHSNNLIDKSLLQSLLPVDDYECYVCGPTPFMIAMYKLLVDLGVPDNRIAYEFFGKSESLPSLAAVELKAKTAQRDTLLPVKSSALTKAPAALTGLTYLINPDARAVDDDTASSTDQLVIESTLPQGMFGEASSAESKNEVVFALSGVTAPLTKMSSSILELAEKAGLSPEFSCRSGICNTCLCNIREGHVEYFDEPLEQPKNGKVLICCSRPVGRVVLEL